MSLERARVFVALPLASELGEALLAFARDALHRESVGEAAESGFRWPRAEGLHLTLLFLGDVERARAMELWAEVEARLAGARAPLLAIGRTGSFPGGRGPQRVLWFGLASAGGAELAALRDGVLAAAETVGFDVGEERARPFHPHVTVARPRRSSRRVSERFLAGAPELAWTPRELVLFESVPSPGGARYVALASLRLADPAG